MSVVMYLITGELWAATRRVHAFFYFEARLSRELFLQILGLPFEQGSSGNAENCWKMFLALKSEV